MDETLIAELLRYCRTTYGIDLSRSSSARDLLSAEICLLKCLVRLGRAVMQRWCAALGDGYLGARVTANSIRYRYVGNRQKTVHGLFGAITYVRAYYARLGSTGKGWVPLSERLGIAGGYTPGCQYFMARFGAQQSYEDLLIASRVPVFARRARRRITVHPKFYLFDVGVYRTIRPSGPLDSPEEIDGAALETLVYHELRAAIAYRSLKLELFFWRTGAGVEVDFVAYGVDGLFAIEVQRSRTVRSGDLRGLKQFKSDYPMARCMLLFGGDRREYRDGIELLPVAGALADPISMLTATNEAP